MREIALAALLAAGILVAQEPPASISVSGTVISSAGGDPVRKAVVFLRASDDAKISYEAESDANGRFVFQDVDPGAYTIYADREGFMFESDGATGAPAPGLNVERGKSIEDVKIKLIPLGVISGRVLDEDGDPIRGAMVEAMTYSYVGGKRQLRRTEQMRSNDKGEFRLFGLHPGTFYLHAYDWRVGGGGMRIGRRGSAGLEGYGNTYYPGTSEVAHAAPIQLSAGAQLRGFDIRMTRQAHYSIRGKLPAPLGRQHENEGIPQQNYTLRIVSRGEASRGFSLRTDNENFEFMEVLPGSYYVIYAPNNGENGLYARQAVEVVNADVEGVTLNLMPLVDVSGSVRVEGTPRRPAENLHVSLRSDMPTFIAGGTNSAEVKPDGSFLIPGVPPDVYEVRVNSNPTIYLKSVRVGDEEAPQRRIDLTKESGPIAVVLGTDVGEVEGSVKKASGDAAAHVRVTLIAYGSRLGNIDFSRSGFSDDEGKFHLRNIAPGAYKIFAWEDVPVGAPQDPDFRKPFEKQAVDVKMEPNGHATVELTSISVKGSQHTAQ
jgi:hypothetical protein